MSSDWVDIVRSKIETICAASHDGSKVFDPGKYFSFLSVYVSPNSPIGSAGYLKCIRHFFDSSSQNARFVVEPGSINDLVKIVRDRVWPRLRCR